VEDAIALLLGSECAGGRSERTPNAYRRKLELFQRWVAAHHGGEDAVDLLRIYPTRHLGE
jgi:hypothetical protein